MTKDKVYLVYYPKRFVRVGELLTVHHKNNINAWHHNDILGMQLSKEIRSRSYSPFSE